MVTKFSMPLFVDVQDVILRMQLSSDLTGIEEVVTSGIVAAQLHVERIIDGKLPRMQQNALYYLDAESFSGIAPGGLYKLEVPSGLVRTDAPVSVTSGTSSIEGPFTTYNPVDTGLMKFDYPRGYVFLDALTYGDTHIRVQCETGYEPDEAIPPAIYEAILALVPMVFNSQQTTNRSDDAKSQYQMLTDHANLLLQPFMRTKGFTFRAL